MALIDEVMAALRISSGDEGMVTEAQTLIDACKQDLITSGVLEEKLTEDDGLIRQAIIFFVKAFHGYDNPDAEAFQNAYINVKHALCSKSDYTTSDDSEDGDDS